MKSLKHENLMKQFLEKALSMQDSFKRGDLRPVDVATYLVQDMIVGHIVSMISTSSVYLKAADKIR